MKMEYMEYNEWLKGLKVGDEVLYKPGTWQNYTFDKVVKITPTGIIKTEKGRMFNSTGSLRGSNAMGSYSLQQPTDKIRRTVEMVILYNDIKNHDFRTLTLEQLRAIHQIIRGESIDEKAI